MNEDIRSVILELLDEAYAALKEEDPGKLRAISDDTLRSAGIFQDTDSISVAVMMYSLAKMLERKRIQQYRQWEIFKKNALISIKNARNSLNDMNLKKYQASIKSILDGIGKLEGRFGQYVTEVIEQAKIKKGSGFYEHGISVSRAADLMGISPWELSEYLGQRKETHMHMTTRSVKERLSLARSIFK